MTEYPIRVEKSERMFQAWEQGDGDMTELAIGLYDLTHHFKYIYDNYMLLLQAAVNWSKANTTDLNYHAEVELLDAIAECENDWEEELTPEEQISTLEEQVTTLTVELAVSETRLEALRNKMREIECGDCGKNLLKCECDF